jgi:hypothetical protein
MVQYVILTYVADAVEVRICSSDSDLLQCQTATALLYT